MPFTALALLLALAAGYLLGGRLHRVADAPLRARRLLAGGLGSQVLLELAVAQGALPAASAPARTVLVGSQALVLAWLWRNRHLPGTALVGAGVAANAAVIAANGAMPVSPHAIRALGRSPGSLEGGKHLLMDGSASLPWLADVVPLPGLGAVVSVGDALLVLGLLPLVVGLMTHGRRASDQGALPLQDA